MKLMIELLEDRLMPALASAPALLADASRVATVVSIVAVSDASKYQNGVSPEYMTALASDLNASAWFNMPHTADDDYVRTFARAVTGAAKPIAVAPVVAAGKMEIVLAK